MSQTLKGICYLLLIETTDFLEMNVSYIYCNKILWLSKHKR